MVTNKWLAYDDRKAIEKMYAEGKTVDEIARITGRNRATIYKELRKGDTGEMDQNGRPGYSAKIAQEYTYKVRRGGLAAVEK